MQQQQFVGLTMPVFTAFGWAGEETALNFALSQLEEFINGLHMNLPRDIQTRFPFYGLDRASQSVYLASSAQIESGPYFTIVARPLSLELQFVIRDKMALAKAWKACETRPERWLALMQKLERGWAIRAQQMEWDEEAGEATFYQDLYKDDVSKLDVETGLHVAARAAFLNSDPKWMVQYTMSFRVPSEQIGMMGTQIIDVATEWLRDFMPLYDALMTREPGAAKKKARAKKTSSVAEPKVAEEKSKGHELFTYVSRLRPLHIRRGFVNLTPEHWQFFAVNARSTTREVTLSYEDRQDSSASVWRLAPSDQARVILTPRAQDWLEDNFEANDRIQVTASKLEDNAIEIKLEALE